MLSFDNEGLRTKGVGNQRSGSHSILAHVTAGTGAKSPTTQGHQAFPTLWYDCCHDG